jgi:uncharacterized protein
MFGLQRPSPDFQITHERDPSETLLAGFSSFGLAGLTAVDSLVDHLDLEEQGYLTVEAVYGLGVDSEPLEAFAAEVEQYYAELADRMESQQNELPEDRMYM